MNFNLNNAFDREKAKIYFDKLLSKRSKIELTEKRTIPQNSLLHMWFGVLADHIGYASMDECKKDIKKEILGMDTYVSKLTGQEELKDYETHLFTTEQMSSFMDKLKIWAQTELGCYLPYYKDPGYEQMIEMYKNRI